jgi:hypothetical protein
MAVLEPEAPDPGRGSRLFDDELLGLDPAEPEVQAFAAHLDRMRREPSFTVEASLTGVGDFADAANRAEGGRRWLAVLVVVLLLAGVVYVASTILTAVVAIVVG